MNTHEHGSPWPILAAVIIGVHLCASAVAFAATTAELRSSASSIASQIQSDRAAGRFDLQAQQSAVQRLGQLVLGYIDVVDRAALDGGDKEGMRASFRALSQPLQSIYD
jgi:hypothetical protein